MQIGSLVPAGSPEVSMTLEGRGLRGGGKVEIFLSLPLTLLLCSSYSMICYREIWPNYTSTGGVFEGHSQKVP